MSTYFEEHMRTAAISENKDIFWWTSTTECDLYIILQIKSIPWPYYYLFYCKYSLKKQKILWKAFSVAVIDINFVKMI